MERRVLSWLPDYDIAENGEIRRITKAKTRGAVPYVVKGCDNGKGRRRVTLILPDGTRKQFMIFHLVCEAFHGPRPHASMHCAHWDGNIANDHFTNLRWATAKENVGDDRMRHGRTPRGERNGRCKLTADQVKEMRRKYTGEYGQIERLAREYGLSSSATHSILKGGNWSWL